VAELKWGRNKFFPFLALSCSRHSSSSAVLDEEEEGVIHSRRGVSISQAVSIAMAGRMHLPSFYTLMMAVEEIRKRKREGTWRP